MIVYGSSLSPYVRKVLAFAAEKGIELENRPISMKDPSPEFREISPFGKIPAFRDGDFGIADSTAIVTYLDAKYPEPMLIPTDPQARARAVWFEEFSDTVLVAAIGKMFFNRIVAPRFMGREGDLAAADAAEQREMPPVLDYLERVVPDASAYLIEDRLTLADIAVASPVANLRHLGTDLDRWPRTRAWADAILARPSFAPLLDREAKLLNR